MQQNIAFLFHERDRLRAWFRSLEQSWGRLPLRPVALDATHEIFNGWADLVSDFADAFLDDGEIEQESVDELFRLGRWLDARCRDLLPPDPPSPEALDAAEELRRRIVDLRAAAGGVYAPALEKLFLSLADYGELVSHEFETGLRSDQIDEYLEWFSDQTRALLAAEAKE